MSRSLRFSRWRRLPGVHRVTEQRIPTHRTEAQRFTLYLSGELLDLAERLARMASAPSPQAYCEEMLARELRLEELRQDSQVGGIVQSALQSLDGYVQEEALDTERDLIIDPGPGAVLPPAGLRLAFRQAEASEPGPAAAAEPEPLPPSHSSGPTSDGAARLALETILNHAALGEGASPDGFLPALRRGEPVTEHAACELLGVLVSVTGIHEFGSFGGLAAWALHRLAFEPQVLLNEAWPALAADVSTVGVVRAVQAEIERLFRQGASPTRVGSPQ